MRPRQEVPQRHELAVVFILDIDDAPAVLTPAHRASTHDNGVLTTDDGEGDHCVDGGIGGALFFVLFVVVVGVHAQVMEGEFFLDTLLEGHALFEGQGIGLGDDGDDIDDVRELLQDHDVDGLETVGVY